MYGPLNAKFVRHLFYSYFFTETRNVINNVTNMFKCIMTKGAKIIPQLLEVEHSPFSQCSHNFLTCWLVNVQFYE